KVPGSLRRKGSDAAGARPMYSNAHPKTKMRGGACRGKKFLLVALLLAELFSLLSAGAPGALAQAKWEKLAPFPEPAEEILGAAAGGKMYVFAGFIPFWKPKGLVYEYDPATDHWTKKKPMALPSHHVAFTEYHGKIYAFGGFVYP